MIQSRAKARPSSAIYCHVAPSNVKSHDVEDIEDMDRRFRYLVRVVDGEEVPKVQVRPGVVSCLRAELNTWKR